MEFTMYLELFTAWAAFGLAALSPGPNMVAVASTALGEGRRAATLVALGISCGALMWSLTTLYGLARLFEVYPQFLTVLSYLGGGYLLFLASKGLRAAIRGGSANIKATGGISGRKAFFHGLTVTATNPKVALFWASIATFVTSVTQSNAFLVIFAFAIAFEAFMIYGSYGYIFSTSRSRQIYNKAQRPIEGAFAFIFAGLGIALMI